jgi:hypothetical protein
MFFNFRYPLVLFLSSFILMLGGMMLKVLHWPGGQLLFGSMLMVQAISIIWLIVVIIKTPKP